MKYLVDPYDNVREAILQFREDVESNEEPLVYSDFYRDLNGELPKSLTGLPESLAIYYRETERICNDYGKREAAAIGKMKEQDDLRAGRREQP